MEEKEKKRKNPETNIPQAVQDLKNSQLKDELFNTRNKKILFWARLIMMIALVSLIFIRLFANGTREIYSVDGLAVINISIQLFAIINPLSVLPTFEIFVEKLSKKDRNKIVDTTTVIVIALIFAFALFGQLILGALQITIDSFRLGGGILLLILAIDMLSGTARTKTVNSQEVAIVPLATPLLVGPGTMTTLIVLTGTQNLINVLAGGIVAAVYVFLALRYADKITTLIGRNGLMAASRLMAIILAAIAANMIHGALLAWGIAKV